MANVYIFPGVPQIFRAKVGLLRQELEGRSSFYSHTVYLDCDEATIAPVLDEVDARHPEVNIGSYLRWGQQVDYRTKLTMDGRDEQAVERCYQDMLASLPQEHVLRSE